MARRQRGTSGQVDARLVIGISVLVSLVTICATIYFFAFRGFTTSWGERILKSEQYVWISDETLTQDDLEKIASIKPLRSLTLINCNVAECRLPELRFASKKLYRLNLSGTKGLWDLSFLTDLGIQDLDLTDCSGISDLSMLNWETLDELHVDGTDVTDLSPAAGSGLTCITFSRTKVSDLTPLAEAPELWEVDGSDTEVTTLEPLKGLTRLWRIRFNGCAIRSFPQEFPSGWIREVQLANTQVKDLTGLAGCESLDVLNLSGCKRLRDLAWLDPANYATLTTLNLSGTKLKAADLSWLSQCTEMLELSLDGIELKRLSFCKAMPKLELLSCVNCGLTSLSGLSACSELETVLLAYNHISSCEGLPTPHDGWPDLLVDLSHNELTTVRDLPAGKYRALFLYGNDPDIGRTVPMGPEIECLIVPWFSGIDDSRLRDSDNVYYLCLLDCPEEEMDKLSSVFWWHFKMLDENEFLEMLKGDELYFSVYFDANWYVSYVKELAAA